MPLMTRSMLAWVVYPATMTGAFVVHAALQSAGIPILAAAYVAVTLAAGAVTFFEFVIPYDRTWQPRWADVKNDLLFMVAVQMVLPQLLGLVVALTLLDSVETLALPVAQLWPRTLPTWLQVALMLLVAELLRYPLHVARAQHQAPLAAPRGSSLARKSSTGSMSGGFIRRKRRCSTHSIRCRSSWSVWDLRSSHSTLSSTPSTASINIRM